MFRRLAAHAPVGLFLADGEGGLTYVNGRWCEMAGIEPETALGEGWLEAVHPDDRKWVADEWRRAAGGGGEFHGQFRFLRSDGDVRWVNASGSPMDDPQTGAPGFIGSCTDITERKQWEARMRLYEEFLGSTPDSAYVFNRQRRFVYANKALLTMWGKSWEEAEGRSLSELGYPDWHVEMHEREIDEVFATKEQRRGDVYFHGTHGKRLYDYILLPVIGENGEVEAVAGTTRDVTERKRAEERAGFLSRLGGKLASLHTEREIIRATVEAVGLHFGCQRCYFLELLDAGGLARASENWLRDDAASLEGEHRLVDFGQDNWWQAFSSGDHRVEDVATDPLTAGRREAYEAVGVRSYAVQPFTRAGEWSVVLAVTDDQPRDWTRDELDLLENVVARVWPLVEQARAVEATRRSQERLKLVSDNIPAVVGLIGRDHRFHYGNERCHDWFDFPEGQIEGTHMREVMGDGAFRFRLPYIERVMRGETVKFEAPTRHRKLGMRDLELIYTPDLAEDGKVRGFFVMGTDITVRKEEETAIKRQNEARRLLGEAGRVILNANTPGGMLRRMCETVSGFMQADICVVVTPGEDNAPQVEFARGLEGDLAEQVAGIYFGPESVAGTSVLHRMAKAYRETGAVLHGEGVRAYSCRPLLVGRQLLGVLLFGSRLRGPFYPQEMEFLDTLAQYVTGAHVRLRLLETLRESDQRKDQFLATLAHELRSPLAPITTGLEVLKRSTGDPGVTDQVTGVIERQAGQMVRLIDDLLDISRVNTGKIVLKKSVGSYAAILRNAIEAVQPLVDERGHALGQSLPPDEVLIDVDPSRVAQVVSNLLSNAAKYTPDGGRLEVEGGIDGRDAWVVVRDNGYGIAPAEQRSIFELFQQTANASADGLGIGLTLVKSLVELHGGSVSLHSEGEGRGSEFRVNLPDCVVQESERPAPEVAPATGAHRCRRVLVVDDGKSAADVLALFFRMEGMEVEVAYDGLAGVEKARVFDPDLVMMDLGMPNMDGLEAARRMRAENIRGTLVALSGWGREEDKRRTAEAGFDHHVVKPVRPDDLRAIVGRYFGEE